MSTTSTSPKPRSEKGAEEGDFLKQPDPKAPMPGHKIVLRHQSGEDWDYAVIEHLGTKATVDAAGTPAPAGARDLNAWHVDTFVNGPAWLVFSKAIGLDDPAKSAGSVYVVSVFHAAPGHRDELEKPLAQPPGPADTVAGTVLMQHLEGGPWQFLTITRLQLLAGFCDQREIQCGGYPKTRWRLARGLQLLHLPQRYDH